MNLFLRLKMNLFLRLKNYNFQNEFRALLENYLSETLRNPLDGVLYNDDLLLMIAQQRSGSDFCARQGGPFLRLLDLGRRRPGPPPLTPKFNRGMSLIQQQSKDQFFPLPPPLLSSPPCYHALLYSKSRSQKKARQHWCAFRMTLFCVAKYAISTVQIYVPQNINYH